MNMKKNYLKIALVSAFAMAAGYNVYSSQEEVKLSEMALENIEALARDENENKGAASGTVTDLGSDLKCEGGTLYSISIYRVECYGSGSLQCQSGMYGSSTAIGPCYEARSF